MTLMGKATMEGLESVARVVLAPHFHQAPVTPKKVSFCFFTHIEVVDGSMLVCLVGGGFTFSCDGMGCDGLGCAEQCLDYVQGADLNALFTVCREA